MYIDVELGLKYVGDCKSIYERLIDSFLNDYKNFFETLKEKYKNKEFENVKKMIHSLKGITLNLGAKRLYEASLKYEVDSNFFDEYIDVFLNSYQELIEIRSLKKNL